MTMKTIRSLALSLGLFMTTSVLASVALAAAPTESTDNPPHTAEEGYAHINHYMTPTEIPDVYKVQLEISSTQVLKPVDVVMVIDGSGSMIHGALKPDGTLDPPSVGNSRFDWAKEGMLEALSIFLDPAKNPGAHLTRAGIAVFDNNIVATTIGMAGAPPSGLFSHTNLSTAVTNVQGMANGAGGTNISLGINEAKKMFDLAVSAPDLPTGVTAANYNSEVKKYVVLLSDGADNQTGVVGNEGELTSVLPTMNNVAILKNKATYATKFLTMGLGIEPISIDHNQYSKWDKPYTPKNGSAAADLDWYFNDIYGTPIPGTLVDDGVLKNSGYFAVPGDQYAGNFTFNEMDPTTPVEAIQELIYIAYDIKNVNTGGYTAWDETNEATRNYAASPTGNTLLSTINTNWGSTYPTAATYPSGAPTANTVAADYEASKILNKKPDFAYVNSRNEVKGAFERFAKKIIEFGEDAKMDLDINWEYFSIYDSYPGMTNWYRTTGRGDQTVKRNSSGIEWTFHSIPLIGKNTLEFYVKFDSSKTTSDLWYLWTTGAWLSYVDTTTFKDAGGNPLTKSMVKYIPEVLIKGGANAGNDREIKIHSAETQASSAGGNTVVRVDMAPVGTVMPVYTPSAPVKGSKTASNNTTTIADEVVSEGTEEMPATGWQGIARYVVAAVVVAGGAFAVLYIVRKRKAK